MTNEKSSYQLQFEALPGWAQHLLEAIREIEYYSFSSDNSFTMRFKDEIYNQKWLDSFHEMKELSEALSAPYPAPEAPHRELRAANLVEMAYDGDDCAFDQPCAFGHRIEGHAVYCHNTDWPDSPRKCRRRTYDPEYRHEDCPGFVKNPDYVKTDPIRPAEENSQDPPTNKFTYEIRGESNFRNNQK